MKGASSPGSVPKAWNACGPEVHLEKGSESPEAEEQADLEGMSFPDPRAGLPAPEVEEEETEGLGEPDLKEAYVQLVQGVQAWQDGCVYRGQFGLNMKLGFGNSPGPRASRTAGSFTRTTAMAGGPMPGPMAQASRAPSASASGKATAPCTCAAGSSSLPFSDGIHVQGLYKADERFGPGIETYADGSQDVGLWFRDHLIRLCLEIPSAFSILSYPEFAQLSPGSRARISVSDKETMEWGLDEGKDPFFYDYKRFLLNDNLTLPPEMHVYSTDSRHLPMTSSLWRDLDARLSATDLPPCMEDGGPWPIINETPLMVRIQKHVYKFRHQPAHARWNMGAILEGRRGGAAPSGPRERLSRDMILKAEAGDEAWIRAALKDDLASADVADAQGYTALAAAAVHGHTRVVSSLLDHGADVNKFSDQGLTALSMSFLLFYSVERTLPEPQEGARKGTPLPNPTIVLTEAVPVSSFYENPAAGSSPELRPASHSPPAGDSTDLRSGSPRESLSRLGSVHDTEKGPDDTPGNVDKCTLCSYETNFESTLCVHNFSIALSKDVLEKSARIYSLLQTPSFGAGGRDKGTMRRMALSMIEHRNRWLTIKLLLHRGADPNLCRVPMQALFLAVKAGDVDGVRLLLDSGARTDIRLPAQLRALTPLHIAAGLPGEGGVTITELLLHAITDVDARAADQHETYRRGKLDLLPSSLKLSNEAGPPAATAPGGDRHQTRGRTALHVACEREGSDKYARDVVRLLLSHRANPNTLWSGHSPLSLSIASGNDLVVRELLSHGADPNLPLTKGLGSALCVVCDLTYENQRSLDSTLALIDQLIAHGADILSPVTLIQGDKVAVGTAVDYGYFRFFQDRKIAHCPFHALMPSERETLLARKRLLEYMGCQLRRAVFAKESQWDLQVLCLSKKVELSPSFRLTKKGAAPVRALELEEQEKIPFFRFCCQCGRSVGVRLSPCARCYAVLTCGKYCKSKAWSEFHGRDCSALAGIGKMFTKNSQKSFWKPQKKMNRAMPPRSSILKPPI